MKTIDEIQQQLHNVTTTLNEVMQELAAYKKQQAEQNGMDFEKIKVLGKRNPINEHCLSSCDLLVKKHYLMLLGTILYSTLGVVEPAWLLLQRIATGVGLYDNLEDISATAAQLDEKKLGEFTEEIITSELRLVFALDAMLIYLSCNEHSKQMLSFIAGLLELLKCSPQEITELSELASIITTQNEYRYMLFRSKTRQIPINKFNFYINFFEQGILRDKSTLCVFGETKDIERYVKQQKKYTQINFYNIVIEKKPFKLSGYKKLMFKNCIFNNIVKDSYDLIHIEKTAEVIMDSCVFSNISSKYERAINLLSDKLIMTNCLFKNIAADDYTININSIQANNCTFTNIKAIIPNSCAIYLNAKSEMYNCQLNEIKANHGIYSNKTTLLLENCKVVNCSRFTGVTRRTSKITRR